MRREALREAWAIRISLGAQFFPFLNCFQECYYWENMAKGSIAELLEKLQAYETKEHTAEVQKAFELAKGSYGNELRESKKFCIKHLVEVAGIVAELRLDCNAVSAALLHDAISDEKISSAEIEKTINKETATLVD